MSPILLRPIREQFEHNRMIRLLQIRLRRRYLVGVNIEDERQGTGVRSGTNLVYPDLVLTSITGARRLHGIVEVETAESVNHLEAMAEWVQFGKVRGAFYLYVPAGTTDIALHLCKQYGIAITEVWSYHAVGDQMRLTMTHRSASRAAARRRVTKASKKTTKESKRGARTAKRAVTATPLSARRATRSPPTVNRKGKTAKRAPKTVKRATTSARRAGKTVGRTAKTAKQKTGARSGRSAGKKAVAKATSTTRRTTKKTVKGGIRRAASGGKISSRATTSASRSASKARRRSPAAGTQKTAASRRVRKHR